MSGTLHIVTSDGAGPFKAMLDTTGTGNFTNAMAMDVITQVPGTKGNIKKTQKRAWARALGSIGIYKRATNINEDFVSGCPLPSLTQQILTMKKPFKVAVPAGATCTGTIAGQSNVCMVKLVNPSNAGVRHFTTDSPQAMLTFP